MKINEIIEESEITGTFQVIDKYCSNFVASMKEANSLLYRGINGSNKAIFVAESPKYRVPQGQTYENQQLLDDFLKSLGFTSLRSNSICCTSNEEYIMGSKIYMIFPYNGFSFTWSSKIADIGSSARLDNELDRLKYKPSYRFMKELDFRSDNMPMALKSGNEITIYGTYMAISSEHEYEVAEYYGITLNH